VIRWDRFRLGDEEDVIECLLTSGDRSNFFFSINASHLDIQNPVTFMITQLSDRVGFTIFIFLMGHLLIPLLMRKIQNTV